MKKLLNDILKENNTYSQKRVYAFVFIILVILIILSVTIASIIFNQLQITMSIIMTIFGFIGVLIGVSVVDKKITNKTEL